jgi:hypothetical protein
VLNVKEEKGDKEREGSVGMLLWVVKGKETKWLAASTLLSIQLSHVNITSENWRGNRAAVTNLVMDK